ncbi:DUF1772 domain-containing protein [Cellulosimicrobium sp. SH8]|uniref:DUF1772 domain-containing protein n=1 Tax=Cellulosimicrobium sp. SH8 TaxID=2952936 RepID=UPI0021F39F4B|nr:DUF1772 domain-containing protein [Cellulosimicrobium sp. SH8]
MQWLPIVAVVVLGLMVGVEVSVSFVINPIVDRLPENAGLLARADGGRMLGRAMPFWYFGSLLLTAGTALVLPAGGWAAWTAAAVLALSIILTVAVLVPINNRGKTWTPETAPADWREQMARWDRYHLVRIVLLVVALTLLAVAVAA